MVKLEASKFAPALKVNRACILGILLTLLRPSHAKSATLNSDNLTLNWLSKSLVIGFGQIEAVSSNKGWLGHSVRLDLANGNKAISGLSRAQAQALVDGLEAARVYWWQMALREHHNAIQTVGTCISELSDPVQYIRSSLLSTLEHDAAQIIRQFPRTWPDRISGLNEITKLAMIQAFLRDPRAFKSLSNRRFIAQELIRSSNFFDKVETKSLTDEQRKAVVVDEDCNLVVAAAGSGKTSVIVAKAGWLIERRFRKPSEILLLAYAKDAQVEMEDRVRRRLGANVSTDLTVQTFHGFGLSIIGKAEGKRPALAKVAEDDRALIDLLKSIVADLFTDPGFTKLFVTWFQNHFAPFRNQTSFQNKGEYWNYIQANEIRSLQGEKLKSFEECEIANFLFLNGVPYEYERPYEHETATQEKRQYQPDFYLTKAGIYIEHFALSASGETPPFIDKHEYLRSRDWKLKLHEDHGTVLIETFSYEKTAGRLTENLEEKLIAHGVTLSPIPSEEIFKVLEKQGRVDPFTRLLATFLQHFKGSQLSIDEITKRAAITTDRPRAESFIKIFHQIFRRYEDWLAKQKQIDFHDMILRATDHVESGRYVSPHDYILVDEFQDISPGRARLLKALLDRSPTAQLFAVGDDWQSIYRFAGSDIAIMCEFRERFGASERMDLSTTFRCAEGITSVATRFVLKNPAQIRKNVRSTRQHNTPGLSIGLPASKESDLLAETLSTITADASRSGELASVLVLGRYRHSKPKNLAQLAKNHPKLDISYMTIHRSKGLEADYIIVVDLCSGRYGFPTEITDDPILNLVLAAPEGHPNAEERRLFYVALTRARRRVFLLADGGPPSPFIKELLSGEYEVNIFGHLPEHDIACPICVEGKLERRPGSNGVFYGCSNWPYCTYAQSACPHCAQGLPIKHGSRFSCSNCGNPVESCPACDGWMQKKNGKYGLFLGCSNWPNCDYTRPHT